MAKNKFRLNEKHMPWILLVITLAAYLPLTAEMGFYWDDWPMLWFKINQGAEGFSQAFTSDRPFLGHLYKTTALLLGNDPLQWHLLTVFFRWTVTLSFWWMLKQLWPDRKREVFWISMLLAIYPGFKQMPIVYVWMNAFIMLLAYVLSYGMMLKAIGSRSVLRWILWTIPSLLLYTFCTISTEYYTGLDICRGAVIWVFLAGQPHFKESGFWKKVRMVFLQWLPYLAVLAAFMFWRVFVFKFHGYQPQLLGELAVSPVKTVLGLAARIIEDAYTATWGAWTEFFRFPNHMDFTSSAGILFWVVVSAAFFLVAFTAFRYQSAPVKTNEDGLDRSSRNWCLTAIALGAFMVVCPGLPYWVTSLPLRLSYPYDRFLVAFWFGSSIFMVGLVCFFLRTRVQRNIILALFAAMAIGGDIMNANSYRKDWNMQKDFIAQLTTRIPSLDQPTILLADNNPLSYESDNSLTGMVNLALDSHHEGDDLPYSVMFFTPRFETIENLESQETIYQEFRSSLFSAHPEETVVYYYSPPGCLRILDPEQHSDLQKIFPDSYRYFIHLSDPKGRIDPEGSSSSFIWDEIFKQPAEQNWCYYFQKADLARQTEDWEKIAAIGDEVLPVMKAGEASEYFPYIEAYINLDRWEDAMTTFKRVYAEEKDLDATLCVYLHKWIGNHKPEDPEIVLPLISAMNSVGCSMSKD